VIQRQARAGLSEADLASWIFGAFSQRPHHHRLLPRLPPAARLLLDIRAPSRRPHAHLAFAEIVSAYIATGLLMLVLGLTGWVRRAMQTLPMPIVMGMVAGVFLQFGLDWVRAFQADVAIAASMTVAFLLVSAAALAFPAAADRGVAVGAVVIWQFGAFAPGLDEARMLAAPHLHAPAFSWAAMVELVVPLAVTVLVVQNGQGIAVLKAAGHAPPINAVTAACGVGAIASAFVGAVSTCLTGPVNAIISGTGERQTQYAAGVLVGAVAVAFGLFSPLVTRLLLAAPAAFIATLAGLAMLRVLQSAFAIAFQGRFTLGALATFLVTVAGIPILNIGAPFWALVAGTAVSLLLERKDWRSAAADATDSA
jgi:benzoate membrane transport protein